MNMLGDSKAESGIVSRFFGEFIYPSHLLRWNSHARVSGSGQVNTSLREHRLAVQALCIKSLRNCYGPGPDQIKISQRHLLSLALPGLVLSLSGWPE